MLSNVLYTDIFIRLEVPSGSTQWPQLGVICLARELLLILSFDGTGSVRRKTIESCSTRNLKAAFHSVCVTEMFGFVS